MYYFFSWKRDVCWDKDRLSQVFVQFGFEGLDQEVSKNCKKNDDEENTFHHIILADLINSNPSFVSEYSVFSSTVACLLLFYRIRHTFIIYNRGPFIR